MAAGLKSAVPGRILILKPSSLGDVVHTLPSVAAIRAHWPESEIAWLINPEWAPLLEGNPDIDRIIEFPRRQFRGVRGWMKIPRWLSSWGNWAPDLALDFQGLLRTALIARFVGSEKIIGLSDSREGAGFFHHETVRLPQKPLHAVDRYLQMVRHLDIGEVVQPVFQLPEGTAPKIEISTPYLLLHPFSRGRGKSLETDVVLELCRELTMPIVLVGGDQSAADWPDNVLNLLGKTTLAELIWLIRHAAFTVSVDSGPMHIAAALTDKLLSIHTWSNPLLVGPYNREAWIWKNGTFMPMKSYQPSNTEMINAPSAREIADFVRNHYCQMGAAPS